MELYRQLGTSGSCQERIENCLYENLLRKPYRVISVADLCKQVGISRKAFYNHYPNKDACLCAIFYRAIHTSSLKMLDASTRGGDTVQVCTAGLEYWKEQKNLLDIIMRNDLLPYFLSQKIRSVLEDEKILLDLQNTPQVKCDMDILSCSVSLYMTMLLRWHARNFDTPTKEMALKFTRCAYLPLFQPPEDPEK